jgi:nucleoside-diphosphate-sugar epimerase
MSERKRILIAGGRGFLGKPLLKTLLRQGTWDIHAISRDCSRNSLPDGVTWHSVDLINQLEIERLFKSVCPTYLVQLAWCAEHGTYWKDPVNLEWVAANLQMALSFVRHGGERCIFAGSSAEYDWSASAPYHENSSPLKPQLLYGASKLSSYQALSAYFEQEHISWVWARIFCPFGQYEDRRRLIPKTCLRLIAGEILNFDSAQGLRDFLHIEDIASAIQATLQSPLKGPINIASGEGVGVREIITNIARHLGREDRVHFAEDQSVGRQMTDEVTADVTRLRTEVGWQPQVSLDDRLRQVCEWWRSKSNQ